MGREPAVQPNQASACVAAILNSGSNTGVVEVHRAFNVFLRRPHP